MSAYVLLPALFFIVVSPRHSAWISFCSIWLQAVSVPVGVGSCYWEPEFTAHILHHRSPRPCRTAPSPSEIRDPLCVVPGPRDSPVAAAYSLEVQSVPFSSRSGEGDRAASTLRVSLFAHHTIAVGVMHVLISGVSAADRCDAVGTGLCARDPSVPVVVPKG